MALAARGRGRGHHPAGRGRGQGDRAQPPVQRVLPGGAGRGGADSLAAARRTARRAGRAEPAIDRALSVGNPDTALAVAVARPDASSCLMHLSVRPGLPTSPGAAMGAGDRLSRLAGPTTPSRHRRPAFWSPHPISPELGSSGHVSLRLDVDGALRFDLAAFPYDDEHYPSLAVELARLFLGLPRNEVTVHAGRVIRLGDRLAAIDSAGRLLIEHLGPTGTIETVKLADVLDGTLEPARVLRAASSSLASRPPAPAAGSPHPSTPGCPAPSTSRRRSTTSCAAGLLRDARIEAADLGGVSSCRSPRPGLPGGVPICARWR